MSCVLVVEDQIEARKPLTKLLTLEGYEVAEAATGWEALAFARQQVPDLILLDVMLPQLDGLTFLSLLRSDNRFRDVPVVLLTGISNPQIRQQASELGVRDCLLKAQFSPAQLLEIIQENIGHRLGATDEGATRP
jgi:CheY-like chemotaxis protein